MINKNINRKKKYLLTSKNNFNYTFIIIINYI